MRFCKDCRHHVSGFDLCERGAYDDLIGGKALRSCIRMRSTDCGPEGKLWEPTLRYRLWQWFVRTFRR